VAEPIASWNPTTMTWETPQPMLDGRSVSFSGTWPTSGMTRDGYAYARPTSAPPTAATAFSSLLPTARATDGTKGGPNQRGSSGDLMLPSAVLLLPTPEAKLADSGPDYARASRPGSGGDDLTTTVHRALLLPTPEASDATGGRRAAELGGTRPSGSKRAVTLATALDHALLPTPVVNDMGAGKTVEAWDGWTAAMQARHGNGNGHGPSLSIEALRLMPTATATDAVGSRNSTQPRQPGSTANTGDTLTDAVTVLSGDRTRRRSPAGRLSSADELPLLWSPLPEAPAPG